VGVVGLTRSPPGSGISGVVGVVGTLTLAVLPTEALGGLALALLLLLTNLNVAMADVVVDATVAVQCKVRALGRLWLLCVA